VPKLVFVLNVVLVELVNFIFGFIAVFLLGLIFQKVHLSLSLLLVPFLVLIALIFMIGMAIFISVACVYFRDLVHVIPVLMQVAFFGTPIMYLKDDMPPKFQQLIQFNPLYYFVKCFRAPIYEGAMTGPKPLLFITAVSIFIFCSGLVFLKKFDNRIVFKL
jgi:ABC-type polysaccharide/polyol phosphate export permease